MRIADSFIFVHIPKTGGTWMREALERVYLEKFFSESVIGKMLGGLRWILPAKYLESRIAPLVFFEYSHHKTDELAGNLLEAPPYKRRLAIDLLLKFLLGTKLWRQPDVLGLLLTHTRLNQLPEGLINSRANILVPLSNPFRWHISRYNYYRKRLPSNKHAADICNLVGEFDDFNNYVARQMIHMQNIYYRSYQNYIAGRANKLQDNFNYPTQVMEWFDKAANDKDMINETPQHYGLLSWFFIAFLLPNPQEVISLSAKDYDNYISSDEFKQYIKRFTFLPTQELNQSTYSFLRSKGYQDKYLRSIKDMQPANTSTPAAETDKYSLYYNKQQLQKIYELEKIVFNAVPAYNEVYQKILKDF